MNYSVLSTKLIQALFEIINWQTIGLNFLISIADIKINRNKRALVLCVKDKSVTNLFTKTTASGLFQRVRGPSQ